MRPMSLAFTFELTIDDVKHRVTNRPGDAVRLRARMAGEGRSLDAMLAEQGIAAYEVLFGFAYLALRHVDGYGTLDYEDFLDRCEDWSLVSDEPARPTVAGPSSVSSWNSPSLPTPPPATGGTNP